VEESLVIAGGKQTPLDAELIHGVDETEAVHHHADGAHDAGLVRVDPIGSGRNVIPARGTYVGDDRIQRSFRVLLAQPNDLIVDIASLNRAAPGAVDAQNHACRPLVLEGPPQARDDLISTGL